MKCTGDHLKHFKEGVAALFSGWGSLQLCKDNMQIRSKAEHACNEMVEDINDWFVKEGEIYADEIEEYLYKEVEEALQARIEDGSIEEVSKSLNIMFRECAVGNYQSVVRARDQAATLQKSGVQAVQHKDDFASDMEDDDEDGQDQDRARPSPGMLPSEPQACPVEAVLKEMLGDVVADCQPLQSPTRVQILQAIYNRTATLLTEAGSPPQPGQPRKKKKKIGKNNVEVDDDGWSTVK